MDTTPLPNQEDDTSDNGILSHYVIRITPHGKFTYDQLHEFIQAEYQICKYVIGRETVPQEHFHLVVSTDVSIDVQEVRDIVRAFVVPFWVDENGKCPKGFGNKQYNLQVCNDIDKAISYAVKLGEIRHDGWSDDYIRQRGTESFEKKKPSNFKVEYRDLCTEFQEGEMDTREFMTRFVQLKAKYGQQVVMHHAYGYALSNQIQRDPSTAEDLVENFLYKV